MLTMDHHMLRLRHLRRLATNYFLVLTVHLIAFFWNSTAEDLVVALDVVIWTLVLAEVRVEIKKTRASSLTRSGGGGGAMIINDLQPTEGGRMRSSS